MSPELIAALAQSLSPEALALLANPIGISMMKKGIIGSITATEPVYAGRQIANGNKLAKIGEDVSQLQLQLSENEVEKQTELYFWQLVSLQEKMNTVKAVETLLDDINKDVNVAINAGVVLRNDLLQVQLRQNEVESQKLKLQNGISLVKMLLSQYCGLHDTTFVVRYNDEDIEPLSLFQDHQQAIYGTVEYQLLDKQVEATELQQKLATGKNMPTVAVGAGYNYYDFSEINDHFGLIFASVNVPISDWWGGSHAIKRKKIERQKAIDEQQDMSELLQIRMQSALNNVNESYLQLLIAKRSIEQAEENLRLNRNYYNAGTSKMSDLLEAQMLYQQSLDKYTDAYTEYRNKLIEYKQSIGL